VNESALNTYRGQVMRAIHGLVLGMAAILWGPAWADSWAPPSVSTYRSEDGQWRLTVVPRNVASPLRYFEDKAAGKPKPGGRPGGAQQALGQMEHRLQGQWRPVWTAPLVNETGPVDAIVSAQGLAVTFDNWHSVGYGGDVVVIYDSMGQVVRSLGLEDILPGYYVRALPMSVSSRYWGAEHGFSSDGSQLILHVFVPLKDDFDLSKPEFVQVRVDMATGRVVPPEGPDWERALTAANAVYTERAARWAKEYEEFKAPLTAPTSDSESHWRHYLVEAVMRVAPEHYPNVVFVPAGGPDFDKRNQRLVRQELQNVPHSKNDVVVLGGPDPAELIRALGKVVAKLPPQRLNGVRVFVAVTPALREAAAQALAPSGAVFVPLDISATIPQSPERLKQFLQFIGEPRSAPGWSPH